MGVIANAPACKKEIQGISIARSQNGHNICRKASISRRNSAVHCDAFMVGWDDGDKDPMNPRSFEKARKWLIVIIVSMASFSVTAASSIYTATYDQMEAAFGNSRTISIPGLSMFVFGIGCGPLCFSPLSEFYGRRPIYLVAWSFYVLWTIPQAIGRNIATMVLARFFCGFSGSTFLAVSGGTVTDLFSMEELQYPMAIFSVSPFLGPCVGPLIGGFINYHTSWRWTYRVMMIWGCSLLVAIVFLVPETYHPIVLCRKAKILRQKDAEPRWRAPIEQVQKSIPSSVGTSLLRPFQLLILEPMCLSLCVFSAILLGILYLFFGAFPLIFRTNYDFNQWQIGLSFLGIGIGLIVGVLSDPLWLRVRNYLLANAKDKTGGAIASEPEFRLAPAMLGSVFVPAGLFIFAWTTFSHIHWSVPIFGSFVFGAGNILVFIGIFTFLVDAYPKYAASALAANTFLRCVFAATFPLFGNQMYETLGFQWASSVLAFSTIVMMPLPYIFFRYGKKIRAKSRYARV